MRQATVAIVRCPDYEHVESALDELLAHLGGLERYIAPGQQVLLKPNLLGAAPVESAVTTYPALIQAVARRVQKLGAFPIIGDSPAFGSTPKVARSAGILPIAEELGIPLIDLDRPVWISLPGARSLRRFRLSRRVLEADAIINLPKLKVHQQMQMTGAIKNLFGCVAGKRKAWLHFTHGRDRVRFGMMLLEYARLIRPTLTITDAVIAMERLGPRHGDPYPLGLLTGGTNVVALDSVHWAILGQSQDTLDLLKAAEILGMGPTDLAHIEIRGLPLEEARVEDFQLSREVAVTFSPLRIVKSALKHFWAKKVAKA